MPDSCEIAIDVYGDFAIFTRPESKVERQTYKIPTPSACRGILNAIYCKPVEFYYEITQIDVMKKPRFMTMKKNELNTKATNSMVIADAGYYINLDTAHTQRMSTYLCDVYYRIHAKIIKRDDIDDPDGRINISSLKSQFEKRVNNGKCFYQPCLGTRECMCFFKPVDNSMKPIDISEDLGIMLYDVFDITNNKPLNTSRDKKERNICTNPSFFRAVMEHGVVKIPEWNSTEIFRKV